MLLDKAAESNNLVQDKYITISVARKSVEEARAYFHRLDADLAKSLGQLDTGARILDNLSGCVSFTTFSGPAMSNISGLTWGRRCA